MTAEEIWDRDFLPLRSKILEIAATLDRLDRAGGVRNDLNKTLEQALAVLLDGKVDRAERVQLLFSRQYEEGWRKQLEV